MKMPPILRVLVPVLAVAVFVTPVATAEPPQTLTARDLVNRPDRWPAEVTVVEELNFGGGEVINAGTKARLVGFDGGGAAVVLPSGEALMLDAADTDLLEAANAAWAELDADARTLDLDAVLRDGTFLPEYVTGLLEYSWDDGVILPGGTQYVLLWVARDGVRVFEPTQDRRALIPVEHTDLFHRVRDNRRDAAQARITAELAGHAVDAEGKPAADALAAAEVYALYYAASWCGYCTQFTPDLKTSVARLADNHPGLKVVLVSIDEDPDKMRDYMNANGFDVAIPNAAMKQSPLLTGLYHGGVPQVVVVDKFGRVEATSAEVLRAETLAAMPRALDAFAKRQR